jgi:hypothetical protein
MIKCVDNGLLTCISRDGKPKSRWLTSDEAIENAKYLNKKYDNPNSKLVAYKCTHCSHYHLTTKFKKIKIGI